METPDTTVASPRAWLDKLGAVLTALLLLGASQAASLLHLAPHLFSAAVLSGNAWIGVYEHHAWQLAIALGFIATFSGGRFAEWGINLRKASLSWRIFWKFCGVYLLVTLAVQVVPDLLHHESDLGIFGPPTAANIAGWLSFEWVFVGISEEILFRGLIQTYLSRTWTGVWTLRELAIPHAGLITTVLFCLAHINPLHPHVNWVQQLFALGLGLYYSTVYYRTGSLLNPILAHNFGDGLAVTAAYLIYFHLR